MFQGSLRVGVAALAIVFGASSGIANAQAQPQAHLALPAASLADALSALSRRAGVEILSNPALLRGKRAPAVRGAPSPEAALRQLLRGSGLTYEKREGAFLIVQGAQGNGDGTSATRLRGRPAGGAAAPEREDAAPESAAEIVVTGSHIARPETSSPMPVSVIRMDEEARFGRINVYDALIRDPAVGAGTSLYNSTGFGWDNGISAVNLRNMGTNRTLTLLDGRRRVSGSNGTAAVDLSMIPDAMIDRVEIVTGGAAAVYGADAVTGVVNIVTKRDMDSLSLSVTQGISQRGDAKEFRASLATGGRFSDDRGHFVVGGTYSKTDPLMVTDRRDWLDLPYIGTNPANTGPRDGILDNLLLQGSGNIFTNAQPTFFLAGQSYILDKGNLRPAHYDLPTTNTNIWNSGGVGGDFGTLGNLGQARGGSELMTVMARLGYDLTDSISYGAYFDFGRNIYSGTVNVVQRQDLRAPQRAYVDNPFMPDSVRQLLIRNGANNISIDRIFFNYPRITQEYDRQNFTIGQSISGVIAGNFKWETYFQYGQTKSAVQTFNITILDNWLYAQDVIANPATGRPVCRNVTARAAGCVPFDVFTLQPYSQAVIDYTSFTRQDQIKTSQRLLGANISGEILSLPYGNVSLALGVENRKDMLRTIADPRSQPMPTNQYGIIRQFGGQAPVLDELDVSQSVTEAYAELVAPLLKDVRFANLLQIEGAYRLSHYDTIGNTDTWKIGAIWSPFEGLSFRAVRSRSVRAPNFGELYSPQNIADTTSPIDPCRYDQIGRTPTRAANCVALGVPAGGIPTFYTDGVRVATGGNPDLKPEVSNSLTLGMILQPRALPGFDLTADYWDIDISNVVASFGATQIWNLCVDLPSIDNAFCRAQTRDPNTHYLSTTSSFYINAQKQRARGIDLGARYRRPLGNGLLTVAFKGSYLIERVIQTTPGQPAGNVYYAGGWAEPHFKGTVSVDYDIGKFGIGLASRIVGAGMFDRNATSEEQYPFNHIPARVFHDLSLRYDVSDRYKLGFGIKNVLNAKSPNVHSLYLNTTQYDLVGRYFFVNANINF